MAVLPLPLRLPAWGYWVPVLSLLFKGTLTLKNVYRSVTTTVTTTGFVMLIAVGSLTSGFFLNHLRIPWHVTEMVVALDLSPLKLPIAINVLLLINFALFWVPWRLCW
jgi:TRAP-type C4-dicarboxylate transport system permease large subunit